MNRNLTDHLLAAAIAAAGCTASAASFLSFGHLDKDPLFLILMAVISFSLSLLFTMQTPMRRTMTAAVLLAAGLWVLWHWQEGFGNSFYAAANQFIEVLRDPYDLEIPLLDLPDPNIGTAPAVRAFGFAAAWIFAICSASDIGCFFSGMLSLLLTFCGFYFGVMPPLYWLILTAAYWMSLIAFCAGPVRSSRAALAAGVSVLIIAVILCTAVPRDRYIHPAVLSDLSEKIDSLAGTLFGSLFEGGSAFTDVLRGANARGKLGSADELRYTGHSIAEIDTVPVDSRMYLRSWVGSVYKNNQWHELPDADYTTVSDLFNGTKGEWYDQSAWLMEIIAQDPELQKELASYAGHPIDMDSLKQSFSVSSVNIDTKYYFIPYDTSFAARVFSYDRSPRGSYAKQYETYIWNVPVYALQQLVDRYNGNNRYMRTYQQLERIYRQFVYQHYMDVPEQSIARFSASFPIRKAKNTVEEAEWIAAVQQKLQHDFTYSRRPGRVPEGRDFVDYFLNDKKEGYCTYFASAGVLLLRAGGVPARYAVGLSADAKEIRSGTLEPNGLHHINLDDRHSHAWAEVYVNGIGWRPCEMTPGIGGSVPPIPLPTGENTPPDAQQNTAEEPPEPQTQKQPSDQEKKQDTDRKDQQNQKKDSTSPAPIPPVQQKDQFRNSGSTHSSPVLSILKFLAGAAAFLLACVFWCRSRLRPVTRLLAPVSETDDCKKRVLSLYAYTLRLISWRGLPLPGGSYRAWTKKIMQEKPFSRTDFGRFLNIVMKTRYSGLETERKDLEISIEIVHSMRTAAISGLRGFRKWSFLLFYRL